MRIDYRVLWFEDNASSYSTKKAFVKDIVENFGFNFVEPRNEVDGSNIETIPYSMYDLIIADMSLANGSTSIKLMDAIRKKSVFTEVLFYSSNGEKAVREELAKYDIDGAYCSGRDNDDFEYKVREVIYTLIKKTQDLNNLRGLVMAEVSELDSRMTSFIEKYFIEQGSETKTTAFKKHLVKDVEKAIKKKLTESEKCDKLCKHKWSGLTINEIIQDFDFDASRKARTVKLIIDEEKYPYDAKNGSFSEDYRIDMLNMRNNLAHCVSTIKDGKEILRTKDGEIEFDDTKFKSIREQIKAYNNLLDDIEATIR